MPTTTVLFEDVDPFADLNFPVTFRVRVDYSNIRHWDVEAFEGQGARGGWLPISRDHALWPVFDSYLATSAGSEAVETQLARELEHDIFWPTPDGLYVNAAE